MATYYPTCEFDIADMGFDVGAFDQSLLTDSVALTIADAIVTDGALGKTEAFVITDGLHSLFPLSESFSIADAITSTDATLGKTEAFVITDGLFFMLPLSEAFSITDTIVFGLPLAESFSIVDTKAFVKYNDMIIRKIAIQFSAGNYVSEIELEH